MKKDTEEKEKIYFEILAVDTSSKVIFNNEVAFCNNLVSNNKIFKKAAVTGDFYVTDEEMGLTIKIKKINPLIDHNSKLRQTYTVSVSSKSYSSLEPFRINFLEYLKNSLFFDMVYIIEDDISSKIAEEIYPSIYKVESFLRKYVIKFFVTKLGPEWWQVTADSEMKKKTDSKKRNETVFSTVVNSDVYLIDFGELGRLIYSQSSGNLSRDDIVNKVLSLEDTVDSLKKFKSEVQTNYNKFFKDTFKEGNFQASWEELEKIRHKVAHNNLFVEEDKEKAGNLSRDLINLIKKANEDIDKLTFTDSERESIVSGFIAFKKIDREVFIEELKKTIEWSRSAADNFVGLQNFIVNILGSQGFDFQSVRDLIHELEREGVVEIYDYNSEKNTRPVSALRFKKI